MAPKSMRSYVESKNNTTAPNEADRSNRAAAARAQARDNGLYFDLNNFPKRSSPRPTSNDGSANDRDVFDTDASMRDDLSSIDDGNDTLSFQPGDPARTPVKAYSRKTSGHGLSGTRHHSPSSYPPTTTDGINSDDGHFTTSAATAIDANEGWSFQPRSAVTPLKASNQHAHRHSPLNDTSSTRATVAPTPRATQTSRVTVIREPTASQLPFINRAQEIPFVRPATSRGPDVAPLPAQAIAPTATAKYSDHDEASDMESSPPATEAGLDDLDYTPEQLRSMQFSELQSQSVDVDPQQPSLTHDHGADLETLLSHALTSANPDRQRELLESLDMSRWEQAGDWFVEKLADITKRSVQLRKEKRRLALELETEMAARHHHVDEKRQFLQKDLARLRAAGLQILAMNTPEKKRRRQG